MDTFFVQRKKVIIEVAVLVVFLLGMYFLYQMLSIGSAELSKSQADEKILGANFLFFLNNQENLSFSTTSMNSKLLQQLTDHSQVITPNQSRGRADPFTSYAITGSLR